MVLTVLTNSVKLRCVPNRSKDLAVDSHLLFTHIVNKLISRLHARYRQLAHIVDSIHYIAGCRARLLVLLQSVLQHMHM